MPNVLDSKPIITGNDIQSLISDFFSIIGPEDVVSHLNDMSEQVVATEHYQMSNRFVSDAVFTNGKLSEFMIKLYFATHQNKAS